MTTRAEWIQSTHRLAILRGVKSPHALTESIGPVKLRLVIVVIRKAMVVVRTAISALTFTFFASDPVAT